MFVDFLAFSTLEMLKSSIFPDVVVIFADLHEICSDFLRFSWKTLQILEISRFQFNFSMIIPEIHLIFDLIFDLILFNFTFNFHIGTTPRAALEDPAVPEHLQRSALPTGCMKASARGTAFRRTAGCTSSIDAGQSTNSSHNVIDSLILKNERNWEFGIHEQIYLV